MIDATELEPIALVVPTDGQKFSQGEVNVIVRQLRRMNFGYSAGGDRTKTVAVLATRDPGLGDGPELHRRLTELARAFQQLPITVVSPFLDSPRYR